MIVTGVKSLQPFPAEIGNKTRVPARIFGVGKVGKDSFAHGLVHKVLRRGGLAFHLVKNNAAVL